MFGSSPYIHPPFKNAASRRFVSPEWNGVECKGSDVSRSTGVFAVEVVDEFWGMNVCGGFPGVVFASETLPLDEVLESPTVEAAV